MNTKHRWFLIPAIILMASTWMVDSALSQIVQVFGSSSGDGSINGAAQPSSFYEIMLGGPGTAGIANLIGPIGFNRVGALATHPVTGVIYACGERAGDATPVLLTIDHLTGMGSEIGPTGTTANISDLSFRPSDNILFAYNASNDPTHSLYTMDITTGAATVVGSGNTNLSFNAGNGIAFDESDNLYHGNFDHLNELDPSTGIATEITPIAWPSMVFSNPRPAALDFHPDTGTLYGMVKDTGVETNLVIITTDTATVTLVGPGTGVATMDGLAFRVDSGVVQSQSSTWGQVKSHYR